MKAKIAAEQEGKRAEEELLAKLNREADEDLVRREAEEKAINDAANAIADEKKRVKLEEKTKLQAEGKWLSKTQLRKKKENDAKRAAMVAAGIIPASALDGD